MRSCRDALHIQLKSGVRLGPEQSTQDRGTPDQTEEVEQALSREPLLIYAQVANGEDRYVYYGETEHGRLLAIVLTDRQDTIRVITAYDLDAGQKRDYLGRRLRGE